MKIDEAINDYEDMKKGWYLIHPENLFDFTIEIMRKYQKIEQIVGNYGFDTSWLCLKKIREVLEDGNDD